jgi:hypothetical protein
MECTRWRGLFGALILAFTLPSAPADAQVLAPGVLPELAPEQQIARLQTNLVALAIGHLALAAERGEGAREAGTFLGEYFADSWPAETSPEYFVSSMNGNWQILSARTEILEVGNGFVRARRDRLFDRVALSQSDLDRGITSARLEEMFSTIVKVIAGTRGLDYRETDATDHIVFTVSEVR